MRAGDIMTEKVICVDQGASVFDAAEAMLGAGVSAVPVVDAQNRIVGMISEADLMRRGEIGTTARDPGCRDWSATRRRRHTNSSTPIRDASSK